MSELFRIDSLFVRPSEGLDGDSATDSTASILRGLSLTINEGEVHAIMGPNGSGKSTLASALLASPEYEVTDGRIFYKGEDITSHKAAEVARTGMVRSFQISAVFPHLTVLENVRIGLQRKLGTSFHFWKPESSLYALNDEAMALLEQVDLGSFAQTQTVELPYGRKRALEIATTLALDPELMLLDEPTQGMGHEDVGRVVELIRKVAANRTVLMVEHNMNVIANLSDTITVLARGSVLAEGPYETVSKDPRVLEAYVGTVEETE